MNMEKSVFNRKIHSTSIENAVYRHGSSSMGRTENLKSVEI